MLGRVRFVVDLRKAAQLGLPVRVRAHFRDGRVVHTYYRTPATVTDLIDGPTEHPPNYVDLLGGTPPELGTPETWLDQRQLKHIAGQAGLSQAEQAEFAENPSAILSRMFDDEDGRHGELENAIERAWTAEHFRATTAERKRRAMRSTF